jgi:hypothetical protein
VTCSLPRSRQVQLHWIKSSDSFALDEGHFSERVTL